MPENNKILVVDDDPAALAVLCELLVQRGYEVIAAGSGIEAGKKLGELVFDLVITALRMPDIDGISLMKMARQLQPQSIVMVIAAAEKRQDAQAALRYGAFDYIVKPFDFCEIIFPIKRALAFAELQMENRALKYFKPQSEPNDGFIIGESPSMLEVLRRIEKVARTRSPILIVGENGAGKERVARAIHNCGGRAAAPFVKVSCAMLADPMAKTGGALSSPDWLSATYGKWMETAQNGTLFFDDIGTLPLPLQSKLARSLQDKSLRPFGYSGENRNDIRILAASREDLRSKTGDGQFREDLFGRLSGITIAVPPLRDRREDIPLLTNFFVRRYEQDTGQSVRIADTAIRSLCNYSWPGNIRQLENLIFHLAHLCENGEIGPADLPPEIDGKQKSKKSPAVATSNLAAINNYPSLKEQLRRVETAYVTDVVRHCCGDKEKAAAILEISLSSLYRKI